MEVRAIHSLLSYCLRSYSSQVDPALSQFLIKRCKFLKYIPHFLRFPIEKLWHYFSHVPVLIHWENVKTHLDLSTIHEKIPVTQYFDQIDTISSPISIYHLQKILSL